MDSSDLLLKSKLEIRQPQSKNPGKVFSLSIKIVFSSRLYTVLGSTIYLSNVLKHK